jgi:hypothetical protein
MMSAADSILREVVTNGEHHVKSQAQEAAGRFVRRFDT